MCYGGDYAEIGGPGCSDSFSSYYHQWYGAAKDGITPRGERKVEYSQPITYLKAVVNPNINFPTFYVAQLLHPSKGRDVFVFLCFADWSFIGFLTFPPVTAHRTSLG